MIRVQLYLPQDLYQTIKLQAKQEGKPAAQVIRDSIEVGLGKQKQPQQTLGEALQELVELGKKLKMKGPTDLSTNIDKYLYEEWDQK